MGKQIHAEYRVYGNEDALTRATADRFASGIRAAVESRGVARIAISGGGSPKPVFALMAAEPYRSQIPWEKLWVFWVDERCVPPTSEDSNYGAAKELLLDKVPLPADHVIRIEGELDPAAAAARYESAIRGHYRLEGAEGPIFDVVQLGMGDDGHTASLFPHTAALHELGRIAVANHVPQQPKLSHRVTLTWPVINAAQDVFFLIEGAGKADPLARVLTGAYDPETLPSQLIQPRNGRLVFLLDQAAAAQLPAPAAGNEEEKTGTLEIAR
jgi:6-phosphogluconolactonase